MGDYLSYISVAIDGPAGAGKSTVSKAVAQKLGFIYADTGAIYRAIAYLAIKSGVSASEEPERVVSLAENCKISIEYISGAQRIFLDGDDVTDFIRSPEVSKGASDVSAIPGVRAALLSIQRSLALGNNIIMDGRDIGTVVLPDANIKIFLTASVEKRAERRFNELTQKGVKCSLENIKNDISYRDKQDSERKVAPLRRADDAVLVDNSEIGFDETVEEILRLIKPLI